MRRRWGREPSKNSVEGLRNTYSTPVGLEARKRAYRERSNGILPPSATPQERADAEMLRRQLADATRRTTLYELIGNKVLAAIRALPALPPVIKIGHPPRQKGEKKEDAVLLISDVQCGLTIGAEKSGGLGEYNHQVMLQEMAYLQDAIFSIMKYHRNIDRLHIWFLGDIVEGEEIFEGQLRQIDMNVVQQTFYAVEQFARFLKNLTSIFREIRCVGVIGNHGRIGPKAGVHDPMSNWDFVVYKILQERLRSERRIHWAIPETWWHIVRVRGWRFLLAHGEDTVGNWGGIPFYGVERSRTRYREMLRISGKMGNAPEADDFDYMVIGHHSRAATLPWLLLNGSWPGGTEFSIKRLQMADLPQQKLFGVYDRFGITWSRDINLKPMASRRA